MILSETESEQGHDELESSRHDDKHMDFLGADLDRTTDAIRESLKDSGPGVDLALIDDYIDNVLEPNDRAEVEKRIRTWRAWHDSYWEAKAYSRWSPDDERGPDGD